MQMAAHMLLAVKPRVPPTVVYQSSEAYLLLYIPLGSTLKSVIF
jgi:hypothetical protein